jgi:hypothetical protein
MPERVDRSPYDQAPDQDRYPSGDLAGSGDTKAGDTQSLDANPGRGLDADHGPDLKPAQTPWGVNSDMSATAERGSNAELGLEWLSPEVPTWDVALNLPQGPAFGEVSVGRDGWLIKQTTEDAYRMRVAGLWRAAAARSARLSGELEAPALIKPIDVVHYLNWRAAPQAGLPALAESTWYAYRSALLWDFARNKSGEFALACSALEAARFPRAWHDEQDGFGENPNAPRKKLENQKRGIPKSDLNRLIDQLGSMNRHMKWGARVQYWIQAAVATGLRPGEWEFARWADESQTLLLAPTIKAKADTPAVHRRRRLNESTQDGASPHQAVPTHLRMRAIPVEPSDRLFVAQHMLAIQQVSDRFSFEDYQTYCRQTLWRACKRLWGGEKAYTLYLCRHQFSANARGKMSREDLVAAMGHSRRDSAKSYAGWEKAHKGARGPQAGDKQKDRWTMALDNLGSSQPTPTQSAGPNEATPVSASIDSA